MTIHVNITDRDVLASDLLALVEAGQDVAIARGETVVATLRKVETTSRQKPRFGAYAHLGKLEDPYMFHGPDTDWDQDKDIFPK